MPEGDTIHHAANRIRPVLAGRVPEEIVTPQRRHAGARWPQRLAGRAVERVEARGKHLLLDFEDGLVVHSHLRMTGAWDVLAQGARWRRSPSRAWLVLRAGGHEVVQFDGPLLELITAARSRSDPQLAGLGPDVIGERLDEREVIRRLRAAVISSSSGPSNCTTSCPPARSRSDPQLAGLGPDVIGERLDEREVIRRLRADDPTRPFGDALTDQRSISGLGNIWKSESCFAAAADPWKASGRTTDETVLAAIRFAREHMAQSARDGFAARPRAVYGRAGKPCPRCGETVRSAGQGEQNRTTYWCPGCQR